MVALADAVAAGQVTFVLRGVADGVTSRFSLTLTSTGVAAEIVVTAGTLFVPDDVRYQAMVVTETVTTNLPDGTAVSTMVTVPSMCASRYRRFPPAVNGGPVYSIAPQQFPVGPLLETVAGLGAAYGPLADGIGMPVDQYVRAVQQYALWALLDDDDDDDAFDQDAIVDIITPQVPEEKKEQVVPIAAGLWAGVDTTLKTLNVQSPGAAQAIAAAAPVSVP